MVTPMPDPGDSAEDQRAVEDRFVALWAEIAPLWGVGPAHARIQALLFLSPRPIDGATIEARLGISHGSCSTGLNELIEWGVARRVNVPGSRRAKFATDPDGWKWLHRCVNERRKRDLEPLLGRAREARAFAEEAVLRARGDRRRGQHDLVHARDRVAAFAVFLEDIAGLVDAFLSRGGAPPRRRRRPG
jgi:DNA-binding transcriptional regulator GbsR (MarR family)